MGNVIPLKPGSPPRCAPTPHFPDILSLWTVARDWKVVGPEPYEISSIEDLPARIGLFALYPLSNHVSRRGFRAKYVDFRSASELKVQYDRRNQRLVIECKRGHYSYDHDWIATRVPTWNSLRLAACNAYHVDTERCLRGRYERNLDLIYLSSEPAELESLAPEARSRRAIVFPVQPQRLFALRRLGVTLEKDASIFCPVTAQAVLGKSQMFYSASRCPDIPGDPVALAHRTLDVTGVAPPLGSIFKGALTGETGVFVDRTHYLAIIRCNLRDLSRVVEHLKQAGFLNAPRTAQKLETMAMVSPERSLTFPNGPNFGYDDRWVFYDAILSPRQEQRLKQEQETLLASADDRINRATTACRLLAEDFQAKYPIPENLDLSA